MVLFPQHLRAVSFSEIINLMILSDYGSFWIFQEIYIEVIGVKVKVNYDLETTIKMELNDMKLIAIYNDVHI